MNSPAANEATFVIGTAGHIDHGKTSLVRALTGRNLDVLPEEKERGITIALGFTHKKLDSGRRFAFVDVPGHERLIRTMVSGAAGIDAVLFCVSATEGVMPQTQEHLDILQLLGVSHGVVALTHCDLVEDELAELATEELRELLADTFLHSAQIIRTSALEETGLKALETALEALPLRARNNEQSYRLPIDRVFQKKGFGAVVTGTALSGSVAEGEEMTLYPSTDAVRIRGIQVHEESRKTAHSGERTALNLAGIEGQALKRGMVVASTDFPEPSAVLDVRYRHLANAPRLKKGSRVRLLIGTSEILAVTDLIDPVDEILPGQEAWVQLRCECPVLALPSDRFVLRLESPLLTLGGGEIVDPWAPRFRSKNRPEVHSQLKRLHAGDFGVFLERGGVAGLSRASALERLGNHTENFLQLADRMLTEPQLQALEDRLIEDLGAQHKSLPLAAGIPRRSLRKSIFLELSTAAFDALISRLNQADRLREDGPRVRLPDWTVQLGEDEESAVEHLMGRLNAAKWAPPDPSEIRPNCEDPDGLIAHLVTVGQIHRIGGKLYSAEAITLLQTEVQRILDTEGSMSPGRFKELTTLSRKPAIPLLEYFDAIKVTKRSGDTRIAATSYSQ